MNYHRFREELRRKRDAEMRDSMLSLIDGRRRKDPTWTNVVVILSAATPDKT